MSEKGKLSALGKKVESLLQTQLNAMTKEIKEAVREHRDPTYSLTDLMKVTDRALKLEAIRNKTTDEEGSFFGQPPEGADDGSDDDGANADE